MTIVGLCHEIVHLSATWTPWYSCSIVSNFSNLSLVLHLHVCMHTSLNSCIKSHLRNREEDLVYISVLFVLLPLLVSLSLILNGFLVTVTCVYTIRHSLPRLTR